MTGYGVSIKLTDDYDFSFNSNKRLELVDNVDNLVQTVNIILNTVEGEHPIVSNFGTRLQDLIGRRVSDNFIKYTIKNALIKDPRVAEVKSIIITRNKTVVNAKITLKTTNAELIDVRGITQW